MQRLSGPGASREAPPTARRFLLSPPPGRASRALTRNENLHRVHLRLIRDADLFEDRSQVLAERVARVLGLPDVDDAESARAFAGCVGKEAPDRPVRH